MENGSQLLYQKILKTAHMPHGTSTLTNDLNFSCTCFPRTRSISPTSLSYSSEVATSTSDKSNPASCISGKQTGLNYMHNPGHYIEDMRHYQRPIFLKRCHSLLDSLSHHWISNLAKSLLHERCNFELKCMLSTNPTSLKLKPVIP